MIAEKIAWLSFGICVVAFIGIIKACRDLWFLTDNADKPDDE
jgi:hypothetical protein